MQHIPDKGAQLIRYYVWYSNRSRGDRAKKAGADGINGPCPFPPPKDASALWTPDIGGTFPGAPGNVPPVGDSKGTCPFGGGDGGGASMNPDETLSRRKAKAKWAALIKKVFEGDPLLCPKCGGRMKIISFIEKRDQADVIKRILKHCGLWKDPPARAPPSVAASRGYVQPELELFDPPDFDVMQAAPPDEVYIQADPGDEFPQAL